MSAVVTKKKTGQRSEHSIDKVYEKFAGKLFCIDVLGKKVVF